MTETPETPPHRWYRSAWLWWTLRILMTLWFVEVLLQVVFAAGFISGDTSWYAMHSIGGAVISLLLIIAMIVATLNATIARGARWPLWVIPTLFVLTWGQAIHGYTRSIGIHVVGGSLLFALSLLTCIELWRRRHGVRARRVRDRGAEGPQSAEAAS